jgi:hypothetical protein
VRQASQPLVCEKDGGPTTGCLQRWTAAPSLTIFA